MTNSVNDAFTDGRRDKPFDLTERTAQFGEAVIEFCRSVRQDAITRPLISQVVRSSTSVGANYCEADEAGTKKEFRYRINICTRESRESKHWLRMLARAAPQQREQSRVLWKEAHELNLIFASIFRRSDPDQ
ncbi:MAG: four helix bundle protein [Planctomycetaceae bacterium]